MSIAYMWRKIYLKLRDETGDGSVAHASGIYPEKISGGDFLVRNYFASDRIGNESSGASISGRPVMDGGKRMNVYQWLCVVGISSAIKKPEAGCNAASGMAFCTV